jgi:aspartate/methionine/tyrosine aminotransferase
MPSARRSFPPIQYLRWIRHPATHEGVRRSLVLSGTGLPDAGFLDGIAGRELVEGVGVDHPLLARRMADDWGLSPEQVLLQPGSHWNLLLAVAARLDHRPGPVVVEAPAYEPLRRIPEALGAEVLRLPRLAARQQALDLEALEALAARGPSLLVLSHPHNPSMQALHPAQQRAVAEWSRRTGCAVLSDEVYLEFLEDPEARSLRRVLPEAAVLRSFTKVMGLGSIRCSALVADVDWIRSCAAVSDYGPVFLPLPSQAVALRAWERREELWGEARRLAAARRPLVRRWAEEHREILDCEVPDAGIIAFARLKPELARAAAARGREGCGKLRHGFGLDDEPDSSIHWIADLKRREGILVTPGAFFEEPHGFRLGYGIEEEALGEGLRLLGEYLREATRRTD